MTKYADVKMGMARKRERHFPTRYRLFGKIVVVAGLVALVALQITWSQNLTPSILDARSAFDAVLNEHDEYTFDWTFQDFQHRDQEEATDLFLIYLWDVTNPDGFSTDGFKPRLEEKGPYAFVKRSYKYDIDWPQNSERITFKEWHYYEPVRDAETCRLMWFRQGLSGYNEHAVDHPSGCSNLEETVTLFNPKFMLQMSEYKTEGLLGRLSQDFFARIEEAFTAPKTFQWAVKAELLPDAFESIWNYRTAVHASTAVASVAAVLNTTTNASVLFAGTDDDSTLASSTTLHSGSAVFGTAKALEDAGARVLSVSEADRFLDPATPYGILNFTRGVPLWVGAGRYLGYVAASAIDDSTAPELAFWTLVNETGSEARVKGIASYLYENWMAAPATESATAAEWGGTRAVRRHVLDNYFSYDCAWGLSNSSFRFYAYGDRAASEPLNATVARLVADRDERDARNDASIHHDENYVRYWQAYEYCNASRHSSSTSCAGMADATTVARHDLPVLLAKAEGYSEATLFADANLTARIRSQVCAISAYLFEEYALGDLWHEAFVARWMTEQTDLGSFVFSPDALEDLGYAQWAGGYVTTALWGVPSVWNIQRQGYWKFYDSAYTEDLIEFHSQAMAIGYEQMNLTVNQGKLLLRVLAASDDAANEFRGNIIRVATTYNCDGADCDDDDETSCSIGFLIRDDRNDDGDDGLDGTCDPFGDYCDCAEGGDYFFTQNAYANFSKAVPASTKSDTIRHEQFVEAANLMNEVFYSSSEQCTTIQELFQECEFLKNEPIYKVWVTNCEEWETTISDGTFGIYCDETSILKIDTPYKHDYQSATSHPYPRRRGNVIASWLQAWAWQRVLTEDRISCDSPNDCDHAGGVMFVTHSARRLLFEGYVDRLSMKLLNSELGNFTLRCVNRSTVEHTEYCLPIENTECSDLGFEIVSALPETDPNYVPGVAQFSRDGKRAFEWYRPELALNLRNLSLSVDANSTDPSIIIKNPAFAIYPGKIMEPSASGDELREAATMQPRTTSLDDVVDFHKENDCLHRFLGGPKAHANCNVTINTGKRDLSDVRRLVEWYGNETLRAGVGFVSGIPVSAGLLLNSDYQLQPFGWEGFKWLNFSYKFRYEGLDYLGNESIYVIDPDLMLVQDLERQNGGDLDIGMADSSDDYYVEWPTRKEYDPSNYTRRAWIRGNRYETTRRTFSAARLRAHDRLRDTRGMPYTVPIGMASIEILANTPIFVSLPHFYGNAEWGGFEYRQVYMDTDDDRRLHSYYVDVEPVTGQAIREARRYQYNFRIERDAFYPEILSSQDRCEVPTAQFNDNGFGCFMFFPVWWVSEERVIDQSHALHLKHNYLDIPPQLFEAAMYGGLVAFTLLVGGLVPWLLTNRREAVFRSRIYVD
ncbi:hypothetical protein CTAYLR_006008 [Chrysophaeum taylorii]|uniref:Uncharacterized protein n=1 Tax=Chrysophaeum taylorii TaxID=2483200 RepID=A0AAD7U746_9STRA|nr:hypothetical protein CTAYLR_006008 [Chrysophaeum taylorii]